MRAFAVAASLLVATGSSAEQAAAEKAAADKTVPDKAAMTVQEAIRRLASRSALPAFGGSSLSPADTAKTMRGFAQCVMSSPGQASALMATLPGSREESGLAQRIGQDRAGCLNGGTLVFGAPLLRGLVAEYLLRRDFGEFGGRERRKPVAIYALPSADDRTALSGKEQVLLKLQDFADCTVRKRPDQAAALLAAQPASEGEALVWGSMADVMGACIDAHEQVKATKLQMRGVIAEAAYRSSVQRMSVTREEASH